MGEVARQEQEISPALWEALIRRGMAFNNKGIMFLNRKGRRWMEKQLSKKEKQALRGGARERTLKEADHWGEEKKLDGED